MVLKNCKMRFISMLIVIALLSASFPATLAQKNSGNAVFDEAVRISSKEDSYSAYLSRFSDSDYSPEEIVHQLDGAVLDNDVIEFEISAKRSALYGIGMSYKVLDTYMADVAIGLKVDGEYLYANMQTLSFPRMWVNQDEEVPTDDLGNEYASPQVLYDGYYYNAAIDKTVECNEIFTVYLTEGAHKISILPVSGKLEIEYFKFYSVIPPENYTEPGDSSQYYTGDTVIIEGEDAKIKSSYYLIGKSDYSSTAVTPQSAEKNTINYIGGDNWKTVGDTLVWQTPVLKAGYYQLGFSYRQSSNIGGKSYRRLTIDGKSPFAEAEKIGFSYGNGWQKQFFADNDGKPYLVYFSEGSHSIALTVTAADIARVRTLLTQAILELGDLYIDITKITGETVDVYRDYDLFSQIPDMEKRLESIRSRLEESGQMLLDITGERSGSNYSVIMNMVQIVKQMLKNKFEAHRYKNAYYSNYCSVSAVLQQLREMPLDIDKICLTAVGAKQPFEGSGFLGQTLFSIKRFLISFTKDYNTVASGQNGGNSVNIWVSWGRDQAQVLNTLVKRSFQPKTGINVNLKLVNASVIQAVLSGNGPDCFLQMTRSEPVNLAMRGVLYDLSQFEDCNEILKRFQPGADVPYRYRNGLYALPDTQNFYMMFYRKDIFEKYGFKVPTTWDELNLTAKLLMRNNMTVYLPNSTITNAQTNTGVGSTSIYPSMLLQNGVSLYTEDGRKTNLLTADAMGIFGKWTDYYTKLKFPISLDFYNRFRTGTTPLGINSYTMYTTLKAAAPEIDGLWGITSIPGTLKADGTVSRVSSGGGTGCVILKDSKNPQNAWEFLKWWTDTETQMSYSNDLESFLGPTGRVALSNVEALKGLSWEKDELNEVISAWENVVEIPEYPGSYYVSRSIYQAFWNVVNSKGNAKDMMMRFGKEADYEIDRKWNQYTNRPH